MWTAEYSKGVKVKHPAKLLAKFRFPTQDGIHYLTEAPTSKGSVLEARFGITGTPPVHFKSVDRLTPPGKPKCVLYFQHKDDDMMTDGKRWWSHDAHFDLALVDLTVLTVPLKPQFWSTVYGGMGDKDSQHLAWFQDCVKNMIRWGITFGGDFLGHGVYETSGTAVFKLHSFRAYD